MIENAPSQLPGFLRWRWEKLERLPELIVPFKREIYRQVAAAFADLAGP